MTNYNFEGLLNKQVVKRVFNMFNHGSKEVRLVGGCVRDAFLSIKSNDLDFAANFEPKEIINILGKNDILYEDFAYQYGSILAYINDIKIQITSLREDTNQIGRHTNIIYTEDWKKDSERRDFTINAIYLDINGKIFDPQSGIIDLKNRSIKFIGDPQKRIQEDYLRIVRFIRSVSYTHLTLPTKA